MFTFAMLCEDHSLRESIQFDHVLVDEFQDTSEIQFKLALLLAGTDNLSVSSATGSRASTGSSTPRSTTSDASRSVSQTYKRNSTVTTRGSTSWSTT